MKNNLILRCPKCKSDELVEIVEAEELLDKYYSQDFPKYKCKNCGEEIHYDKTIKQRPAD